MHSYISNDEHIMMLGQKKISPGFFDSMGPSSNRLDPTCHMVKQIIIIKTEKHLNTQIKTKTKIRRIRIFKFN